MGIKVHEHTFESSGVKVYYRNINPLVALDVRSSMEKQKPKPPEEEVTIAGVTSIQPNEDDPDYIELLDIYEQEVQRKINDVYIRRSKLKFEYPGWEDEVKEYREIVPNVKESDEWIFLTRVIATTTELQEFYELIAATATPSASEVQAAKDSF